MSINIRPMQPEDKHPIIDLLRKIPQFKPGEMVVARELIDIHLKEGAKSGYHMLVAEYDGNTAGYICFGPTPLTKNTWDIYWEAVSLDFQGRGIGSRLIKAAEENIKQANGRLILIETSSKASYERTRHFYRSHDYAVVSRIPDFYSTGDDKLVFLKKLA